MRLRDTRLLVAVAALLVGIALAFPLGVIASHQFSDVFTENTFHADIDALADAGVTSGCAPGKYCPKAYVTREQMAAFMNRLGALQPGKPPVVNATKLDGLDSTELLRPMSMKWSNSNWVINGTSPVTLRHEGHATFVSRTGEGLGTVQMDLTTPQTLGGYHYGLSRLEICHGATQGTSVYITQTTVTRTSSPFGGADIFNSSADHQLDTATCYLVDMNDTATGMTNLVLTIYFNDTATAWLSNVTATWRPAGQAVP